MENLQQAAERHRVNGWLRALAATLALLMFITTILSIFSNVKFDSADFAGTDAEHAAGYLENNTEYLQENWSERLADYIMAIIGTPDSYKEFETAASIAISKEDYVAAADYVKGCIKYCEDETLLFDLYVRLGCLYTLTGAYTDAKEYFNRAVAKNGTDANARLLRAQISANLGYYDDALADLELYSQLSGENGSSVIASAASIHEMAGNYAEAIKLYAEAIDKCPEEENISAYYASRARCYMLQANYALSKKDAEAGLAAGDGTDTEKASLNAMLGICAMAESDYRTALDAFHSAISLGYVDAASLFEQSILCGYMLGEYETVIQDADKAIAESGESAFALLWRGVSYIGLEDYQEAADSLTRCIALNDSTEGVYYYRGICYSALGRPEEAIPDFTESISREQETPSCLYNRALCYLQTEDYVACVTDLASVIEAEDADETLKQAAWSILTEYFVEDGTQDDEPSQQESGEELPESDLQLPKSSDITNTQ
jgi:tetratricopeptide (TPR) repeat protein